MCISFNIPNYVQSVWKIDILDPSVITVVISIEMQLTLSRRVAPLFVRIINTCF